MHFFLKSRRLLLEVGITLLWFIGLVALLMPRSRVNSDKFASVRLGMPLREVEALLGGPGYTKTVRGQVQSPSEFLSWKDIEYHARVAGRDAPAVDHKTYRLHEWSSYLHRQSSDQFFVVLTDEQGRVVCRYQQRGAYTN